MRKFLKILFSTLLVIILLIVIAIAILPFIIDPNDFKPQIAAQVKKMTGRELTLGGDIDLSVFPWLGVEIQKVSLSNPPNFGETPFARADDMEVRVKLLPLLKKRVEMDTVVLSGLDLNLVRNASGKTNWEDLTTAKPQETPPETKPPKEGTEEQPSPLAGGIAIAGLRIEAARVNWRDEVKNVSYTIEHLNLATEPLVPGEPTKVDLACDFSSSQPNVSGHLDFGGKVTADTEANHYHLQDTDLKLTAAGPALPIEQLALQLGANIDASLAEQQFTMSDLKLTSQVQGPQEAQLALSTSLEGNLATQQYHFKAFQLDTQVKAPQFHEPLNATLTTAADMDLKKGTLALQNLNLAALGIKLKGQINGTNLLTNPNFNGQIVSNEFNPRHTAEALAIELPADKGILNKAQLALKFSASPKHFDAQRLIVKLDDSTLKGSLEGDLATQQYRFNTLQLDTKVKSPQFPKPLNATLTTAANMDLKKGTLTLQNLNLAALGVKLNGQINGTNLLTSPNFNGQLVSNQFNPRQTAEALAIELPPTADKGVLNKAQLTLKFSASPKHFDAQRLIVKLDDSTLKGSTAIHNFQQPTIRYDLALDTINMDRYLPLPSKTTASSTAPAAPPASPGAGMAANAGGLPIEALRALNASGLLKIGELTVSGTHSQDIRITLDAKDGLVKLNPLSAKLYQGTYAGDMLLDVRNQLPKLAIDEKLAGVKAGPLLKDLTGDDKILGTANINAKLTANGATPEAIKRSLNGTAGFSFTDGAVKGINIARLIREAIAAVEGKPIPPTTEPEQTDFAVLKGTITATNGLLKNTDLEAQSPLLRVGGQGTANLVKESIDYRLDVAVVKTLKGQGGKGLSDLKGITIPLKISGPLTQPKYGVDLEGIIKARAGKLINEKKQDLEKKMEKGLDKFLGTEPGKQTPPAEGETPSPEQQLKEELKNKLKGIF